MAFVGESGSGKSTLMQLLMRFFDPQKGRICIGGMDIRDMDVFDLRRQIAFVSQDVFLFHDSIEKNIHAGDSSKPFERSQIERAARLANAHEFIEACGYETIVGDQGLRFSGGQRQRLSIARALFKDAPILILDEATSALDVVSEREVQKGLNALMKGRTTFVVTHRLSAISSADRIVVLEGGRVVEVGQHAELVSNGRNYYKFCQLQKP